MDSLGYFHFVFDSQGHLWKYEQEKETRLPLNKLKPIKLEDESDNVIDTRHKFAKRQFDREYRWDPTSELEAAIFKAIFG